MTDILMATYNGDCFIEEQIRSIINQSETDWRLLIHDDGSTDKTIDIISQLAKQDHRIVLLQDGITHLGAAQNFMHLLQYANAPYCMFADQDDIWFENKIAQLKQMIETCDNTKPQVCFANAYLWKTGSETFTGLTTLSFPTTIRQLLFLNSGIQGASAIFNHAMLKVLRTPLASCAMHDHALTLAGVLLGEVHYIHEPLMQYRIHTQNVTGDAPGNMYKKLLLTWQHRKEPVVSLQHYNGLKAFYMAHYDNITAYDSHLIEDFLAMPYMSPLKRMYTVLSDRFLLFNSITLLLGKMCLRKYIADKQ